MPAGYLQTLETAALNIDILLRIFAAFPAHRNLAHRRFLGSQILVDLDFDRQPVAVPARQVGGIESHHGARLDNDVLENLVDRGSHVNRPICVRRAIMEHIGRTAGARSTDLSVNVDLIPMLEHQRLPLRQVRFHAKGGFRQVERVLDFRFRSQVRNLQKV